MKSYVCLACGYVYNEENGEPHDNLAPGTKWEDIPFNWTCPECDARKDDFEELEF